jgi:hypothetical protein
MDDTTRYELRLSLLWRAVFIGAAIMSFGLVIDAFETGDAFAIGASLAFFGFGGLVMLKVMLRNSGVIELRDDGLLIDCYLTTGFVPWSDLESARAVRAMGVPYLGLSTRDADAYIRSREQLSELRHDGDRVLAIGFMRIMMGLLQVLPPAKTFCNLLISVLGFAPLPKQFDEAGFMEWNKGSYGSQLLIHKMWLPQFDQLLADLQSRISTMAESVSAGSFQTRFLDESSLPTSAGPQGKPGLETSSAARVRVAAGPQVAPATPQLLSTSHRLDPATPAISGSNLKPCPMCAERVQPEARICRFCRYSFDEQRFLPAAS